VPQLVRQLDDAGQGHHAWDGPARHQRRGAVEVLPGGQGRGREGGGVRGGGERTEREKGM
jgi:hypothetical protein